jgi:isopenicillin N synthase-like dioxygenase
MLKVRSRATGLWVDLPPATPETCRVAVLVGAQLERALGGAVRATEHRVLMTAGHADVPRYSIAFKLRARHDAELNWMTLLPKYTAKTSKRLSPVDSS